MFCDLVGSTDLSQHLDAEDLRSVVRAYQETASVRAGLEILVALRTSNDALEPEHGASAWPPASASTPARW